MACNYIHGVFIFSCLFVMTISAKLKADLTVPSSWFQKEAFYRSSENERDQETEASERRQDQEESPTMNEHQPGRVQIKVYRGPYNEHEHFAPFGFWVKQPADNHHQ